MTPLASMNSPSTSVGTQKPLLGAVCTSARGLNCHGITESKAAGAPAVVEWESLTDSVVLAQQMWDHGPKMRQAYVSQKPTWLPITGQQMSDVLVYLRGFPKSRSLASAFELPSLASGSELFQSKGCADCHTGGSRWRPAYGI